jgi:hypothetical protein
VKKTKIDLVEKVLKEIILKDLVKSDGVEFKDKIVDLISAIKENEKFLSLSEEKQVLVLCVSYFYFWRKEEANLIAQIAHIEQFCFWRLNKYMGDLEILEILEMIRVLNRKGNLLVDNLKEEILKLS